MSASSPNGGGRLAYLRARESCMDRMCCADPLSILEHGLATQLDSMSGSIGEENMLRIEHQFVRPYAWIEFKFRSLSRRKRVFDACARIGMIVIAIISGVSISVDAPASRTFGVVSFALILIVSIMAELGRSERLAERATMLGHALLALKGEGVALLSGEGPYASLGDPHCTGRYNPNACVPYFLRIVGSIVKRVDADGVVLQVGTGGEKVPISSVMNAFSASSSPQSALPALVSPAPLPAHVSPPSTAPAPSAAPAAASVAAAAVLAIMPSGDPAAADAEAAAEDADDIIGIVLGSKRWMRLYIISL